MEVMQKKKIRILVSYEPNRLADTYLSNAYEKIVSTVKKEIKTDKKINFNSEEKIAEKIKGNEKW